MKNVTEFEKTVARLIIFRSVFCILSYAVGFVVVISMLKEYSHSLLVIGLSYPIAYMIIDEKIKRKTVQSLEKCDKIYKTIARN